MEIVFHLQLGTSLSSVGISIHWTTHSPTSITPAPCLRNAFYYEHTNYAVCLIYCRQVKNRKSHCKGDKAGALRALIQWPQSRVLVYRLIMDISPILYSRSTAF